MGNQRKGEDQGISISYTRVYSLVHFLTFACYSPVKKFQFMEFQLMMHILRKF